MQSMPGQVIKQQYRARLCRAFQKMRADTYIEVPTLINQSIVMKQSSLAYSSHTL